MSEKRMVPIGTDENGNATIDGRFVPVEIWDAALDQSEGAPGERYVDEALLPEGWRDAWAETVGHLPEEG